LHGGRRLNTAAENSRPRGTRYEWIALVLVLVVAFVLRTRRIEDFFVGPDDGAYLHSAQIDVIEPGIDPIRWVQEDVAWVGWFAEHYTDKNHTYPHSYLHQFVARYFFRLGCGSLQSLRLSSAFTGVLTVFFAWWLVARLWPERRRVALLAAALVAVLPVHVFFSRTGWGQVGFACFYLAYLTLLYRVLFVIPDGDVRAFRRAGLGLAAFALLAFGWQEGVAPYIVGSGLVVLAAPFLRGGAKTPFTRRTWTYVWSAAPVGALTLALALWSSFAKEFWFDKKYPPGIESWGQLKWESAKNLILSQRVDLLVGWIVLALALLGFVVTLKRYRICAWYLALSAAAGSVILFLGFTDAMLLRPYMPLILVCAIFAAFGLADLAVRARAAGPVVVGLVLVTLCWTSWTTLFGRVPDTLFVQHLYMQGGPLNKDFRDVDRPILDHLIAHRQPTDTVAVFGDKSAIFRLQDIGIRATENYLEGPPETWPDWLVAARRVYSGSPHTIAHPDAYRYVIRDTIDRWILLERVEH
jgi:hypothetical protein